MPFTAEEFLDLFALYNAALWPFAVTLWILTVLTYGASILRSATWTVVHRRLLAGHWIWAGVMYHALFFTRINPAAWLFAALFVAQGVIFIALRPPDPSFVDHPGPIRRLVSTVLISYSLIYPLIVWADGFTYPRMPTFGVPCPTVLLTIGFLIASSTPSLLLAVIPLGWSLLGVSAVWLFGVRADAALPVAGIVLAADLIFRRSQIMRKPSFASMCVVLAAMLVFVPPSSAFAQAAQHDHEQQAQKGGMKMSEMKMDSKMMDEMAAKKKANTARITSLMAQVKSSTGEAKAAAMAEVIAVLVEERAAMGEHCASMMAMMKK